MTTDNNSNPSPTELPEFIRDDIRALLVYNWEDEERDFFEQNPEERSNHIFHAMRRINDWL